MISENYEDIDVSSTIDIGELTEEEIIAAVDDAEDIDLDEDISAFEAVGEKDQELETINTEKSNNDNYSESYSNNYDAIKEVLDKQKQENPAEANRDETEIGAETQSTESSVDEILRKVYGIVKPICESVDISCEWLGRDKEKSGFIKIFNPKTDKISPFFPTLHLIIYDTDGFLFIKLFYQQCQVFKKSVIKDALSLLNKPEEYIAIVSILASFISELSVNKYQPCQGVFEKNQIIRDYPSYQNLLTEKQGTRIVYRTIECNMLTETGYNCNIRCLPCSSYYFEIFGKLNKNPHKIQILGVFRDSNMGKLTFDEIFQRVSARCQKKKQGLPSGYRTIIQETLLREEVFKESKQGSVTFWEINSAKTDDIKDLKSIFHGQNTKSSQKNMSLSDKPKITHLENNDVVPTLKNYLPSPVKKVNTDRVLLQQVVQNIQKPTPTHLLSRVVMQKTPDLKNYQPTGIKIMSSSQQESFNSNNTTVNSVKPVLNLNSIFEGSKSTHKQIGLEILPNTIKNSPSKNSFKRAEAKKRKCLENISSNPARIVSARTGTIVKYW